MSPTSPPTRRLLLPDFCTPRAVLFVLVIVTLTATLLTLAEAGISAAFLGMLSRNLLFLTWVGLFGAALLCAARRAIAARGALAGGLIALGIVVTLVALLTEISYRLLANPLLNPQDLLGPLPADHRAFLARNVAIGTLVGALALRYFHVAQQWRLNVESQAAARINALQARIRPHFLYNSMNTIAALTRTDPARAEAAVQDLADLFRANLDERRNLVTLADEIETARTYQRIEAQRLGPRLRVRWDVDDLPPQALIPALTLQPLLENAIGHGVENLPDGGEVIIEGSTGEGMVRLCMRNPLPFDLAQPRGGHGIALDNTRERLGLLFGPRASFTAGREGDEFVVQLRFPLQQATPGAKPPAAKR